MSFSGQPGERPGYEVDIARGIKTIEWLKTELVSNVASLFRGMLKNNDDVIGESLANLVIGCYLLGRRLGGNFAALDAKIEHMARLNVDNDHEVERWYGDFSAFLDHVKGRKK